jgi:RimJ/RimL family protein N-acetyltransferase
MAILFMELKAKKLEIYCDAENIASTHIPLKLGFKLEYVQNRSASIVLFLSHSSSSDSI